MIPTGIMEAVFSAALVVAGWLIKHGFTTINSTLEKINTNLSQAINRLVALETWRVESERVATERHADNKKAISDLKEEMKKRRK